jgi:tetratricopeptide (TPR) repeat protein
MAPVGSVPTQRTVRVFIASPGDLAPERRAFKEQVDQLNTGFGDGAGIQFVPLGWEDTFASTGRRVQAVINQEIDTCDVFVLAMHRRWGQPAPDSAFSSYTEEEFHRALQRFTKTGTPEIFVFFKNVDEASVADPGPELTKVLKFRLELERTRTVRYRTFANPAAFRREVDQHLRAFVKGGLSAMAVEPERLPLPLDLVERVERAEAEARKRAEEAEIRAREQQDAAQAAIQRAAAHEARAEALASLLAVQSAGAAREGRVEEARQLFANATLGTTNLQVLDLAFEFFWRTGPLSAAEEMLERWLAVSGGDDQTAKAAAAFGNLGLIYQTRGDLDRAEAMHRQALALFQQHKHREDMANQCTNLGLIYQTRGDLDRAEAMHRQALALFKQLRRREGMSNQCTCLGLIYQARGDLDQAEAMHRQALTLVASPSSGSSPAGIRTIPLVVHVVYRTSEENISDAQINSQITVLNQDYRARNSDLSKVPYPFKPFIGDARIHFELAVKDPLGQSTSGITRAKTDRTQFSSNDAVKSRATGGVDPWDPERYLNIWVCSMAGGMLEYAQFPGGPKATDGVVVLNSAFGTLGSAPFNQGRATTHAIAHYLNLRHIWGDGDTRNGDFVADTPMQEGPNYGKPTFPHISGNNGPHGDMFMNFMDYVDDDAMCMFTKGQVMRMHAILQGPRKQLGRRRDLPTGTRTRRGSAGRRRDRT